MSKYADHDEDGVSHVEEEMKQAWKDGWNAIVPSALTPDAQWQRNDLYVPLSQVKKRCSEADQRDAARYRWLRKNSTKPVEPWSTHEGPESLDAIVDAAMFDARVAAMSAQSDTDQSR